MMIELPKGMISVDEFAKQNKTSPEKVIEEIREAKYVGRKIDGKWYIDLRQPADTKTIHSDNLTERLLTLAQILFAIFIFIFGLGILLFAAVSSIFLHHDTVDWIGAIMFVIAAFLCFFASVKIVKKIAKGK